MTWEGRGRVRRCPDWKYYPSICLVPWSFGAPGAAKKFAPPPNTNKLRDSTSPQPLPFKSFPINDSSAKSNIWRYIGRYLDTSEIFSTGNITTTPVFPLITSLYPTPPWTHQKRMRISYQQFKLKNKKKFTIFFDKIHNIFAPESRLNYVLLLRKMCLKHLWRCITGQWRDRDSNTRFRLQETMGAKRTTADSSYNTNFSPSGYWLKMWRSLILVDVSDKARVM
jgi:hypothetical protein